MPDFALNMRPQHLAVAGVKKQDPPSRLPLKRSAPLILGACVLLLLARGIVWGPPISLDDAASLLLGVLPFVFIAFAERFCGRLSIELPSPWFFAIAWISSLASFLVLRTTYIADRYEDLIYSQFSLEILRYITVSTIYSVIGYFIVGLASFSMHRIAVSKQMLVVFAVALFINVILFYTTVFLIPA